MKCLIQGCNEEATTYGPNEPGHCDVHGQPIPMTGREKELKLAELDGSGPLGLLGKFV